MAGVLKWCEGCGRYTRHRREISDVPARMVQPIDETEPAVAIVHVCVECDARSMEYGRESVSGKRR